MSRTAFDLKAQIDANAQTYKDIAGIRDFESRAVKIYLLAASLVVTMAIDDRPTKVDLGIVDMELSGRSGLGIIIGVALIFQLLVHWRAWQMEKRGHGWRFLGRKYTLRTAMEPIVAAVLDGQRQAEEAYNLHRTIQARREEASKRIENNYADQLEAVDRRIKALPRNERELSEGWALREQYRALESKRDAELEGIGFAREEHQLEKKNDEILDGVMSNDLKMDVLNEMMDDLTKALRIRTRQIEMLYQVPVIFGCLVLLVFVIQQTITLLFRG